MWFMLKIALVLVKNVFFGLKKGISELLPWVAPKYTAKVGEIRWKLEERLFLRAKSIETDG